MDKALEDEQRIEKIKSDIERDSQKLAQISPDMEALKMKIREYEAKIVESGGSEYKQKKEELD